MYASLQTGQIIFEAVHALRLVVGLGEGVMVVLVDRFDSSVKVLDCSDGCSSMPWVQKSCSEIVVVMVTTARHAGRKDKKNKRD